MADSRPNAYRILASLSIFSAFILILILLVFLGGVTRRFSLTRLLENLPLEWTEPLLASGWTRLVLSAEMPSGSHGSGVIVDILLLMFFAALLIVTSAGSAAAYLQLRDQAHPASGSAWLRRVDLIRRAAEIFLAAGLTATVLEAAGLWKKLVSDPDPFMEKGAPIWIWWIVLGACFFLSLILYRHAPRMLNRSLRITLIVALAALLFTTAAGILHVARPDPVQGRYYKIPGFIVGRQFPNEYGTYYGVTAGATATILALSALAMILRRTIGCIKSRFQS